MSILFFDGGNCYMIHACMCFPCGVLRHSSSWLFLVIGVVRLTRICKSINEISVSVRNQENPYEIRESISSI